MTKPRRLRGDGTIYKRPNGTYAGQVDLGHDIEDRRRRRTVYGRTQEDVQKKMRALLRQLEEHGDLPTADMTLEKWLTYWLDTIAAKRLKPNTFRSYRTSVNEHIIPSIGKRRLSRLSPAHIRQMHDDLIRRGKSSTTALNAHRVLSVALNDAVRDGTVPRNIAALVTAPSKAANKRQALTVEEAVKVLQAGAEDRLGTRWLAAFLLGLRQGERLGLRWSYLDLEAGVADLSWALQRVPYAHDCGEYDAKLKVWPCKRTARSCPHRRLAIPAGMEYEPLKGNLVLMRPKTKGSRRVVALIEPLRLALLRRQEAAKGEPNPHDLVWCDEDGSPIDPRDDWQDWRDLFAKAKVRPVTLHEARHTTATLLLEAGVDPKVIGEVLGHSDIVVTQGYQHVSLALQRQALNALGSRLELTGD